MLNWLALGLLALGLLTSYTRTAWMGMFLSAAIVVWSLQIYRQRWFWLGTIGVMVLIVGLFAAGVIPTKYLDRLRTLDDPIHDNAMAPRYLRWHVFFNRSMERPLLGWGIVSDDATRARLQYAESPHSSFLFVAVQRGWIAVGLLTTILIVMFWTGWNTSRESVDGLWQPMATALFGGGVAVFVLATNFESMWEDQQTSILFWLLLALTFRVKEFSAEAKNEWEKSDLETIEDTATEGQIANG
jgi:hypothetical protein